MRLLHSAARTKATFDAENVVSFAGLEPVMCLAQDAGLHDLVAERVRLGTSIGSNPAGKTATIVAGMVAGADSIDDLDALRHGGMDKLFGQVYAPSTLGSFLREFRFGHVRQLESAAREMLVALAGQTPVLAGTEGFTYVDVDSLLRRTYGHAKQGASFGHTKVGGYPVLLRGLSPLVATISTDAAPPVIASTRLRGGRAGSARGAASLVAEALGTARTLGADTDRTARLLLRGDSAFYTGTVLSAAGRHRARFSVTVTVNPAIRRAIHSIPVAADLTHRAHAVVEQVFADLIDGPLAHLPSGRFAANAAWLTCAAIAHNLLRAAASLTSRVHARARSPHPAPTVHPPRRRGRPARPRAAPRPAPALALGRLVDAPVRGDPQPTDPGLTRAPRAPHRPEGSRSPPPSRSLEQPRTARTTVTDRTMLPRNRQYQHRFPKTITRTSSVVSGSAWMHRRNLLVRAGRDTRMPF